VLTTIHKFPPENGQINSAFYEKSPAKISQEKKNSTKTSVEDINQVSLKTSRFLCTILSKFLVLIQ
jgi:hypothetical protein